MRLWTYPSIPLTLLLASHLALALTADIPADYPTVQAVIDSCAACDTIRIAPGRHFGQIVIPDRNVTLVSHFVQTGDTSLIAETILDGENVGMLLDVGTVEPNRLSVCGLTLSGGFASRNSQGTPSMFRGGAVNLRPNTRFEAVDCRFTENNQDYNIGGAVLFSEQAYSRARASFVRLERVTVADNLDDYPQGQHSSSIVSVSVDTLIIEDLHLLPSFTSCPMLRFTSFEQTFVDGLHADGLVNTIPDLAFSTPQLMSFSSIGVQDFRDILIHDCHQANGAVFGVGGSVRTTVRNFVFQDNLLRSTLNETDGVSLVGDTLFVDSLIMRRNTVFCGIPLELLSNQLGEARHVEFVDNVSGDSL